MQVPASPDHNLAVLLRLHRPAARPSGLEHSMLNGLRIAWLKSLQQEPEAACPSML